MVIPAGTEFGRYSIVAHLGRAFASELYQARDNQLERPVTLRIFDRKTLASPAQMQLLAEDLKAASAIAHRNIAATFEIASFDDTTLIATEFIEGVTLRSQLELGTLPPLEATYVAVQIASAVAAAHEAGLIHGDIRPDNIVLKPDGVVKLSGLGQSELAIGRSSGTRAASLSKSESTESHELLMYASPERTSGIPVDEQSDIWSIGVLLYEMLAGRPPFSGDTSTAVVSAILNDEPLPIAPGLPSRASDLDAIVRKVLRKQKSERYGSARELLFDLKRLWQRMEVTELVHRIHSSSEGESAVAVAKGPFTTVPPASRQTQSESSVERAETSPTGWSVGGPGKRILIASAAVVFVAIASIALYRLATRSQRNGSGKQLFQSVKIDKLTTSGKVTVAAVSPDGRSTVHAIDVGGKQSLWVRQLASTNVAQIVPPAEVEYQALSFSNDGNSVFYVLHNKDNPIRELFQVATFGGSPQRLLVDVDSPVSFSPDGKSMAFVRRYSSAGEDALMIAGADGTNERRIASRKQPSFFSTAGPAWSPDGKLVAVGAGTSEQGKTSMSVAGVTLNGGTESPLTEHKWYRVGRVAWAGKANTLLVNAVEQTLGPYQIWQFSYPGGEVRKITNDASDYRGVTVSNDASTIVTVQSDQLSNIWVAPGEKGFDKAKQISSGKYDGFYGVSVAPDGKLVYATNASGKQDLWAMDQDGSGQRRITSDSGANVWPSVSPDGRSIVLTSDRTGVLHIWKSDHEGNNLKQLTFGEGEDWAHFTTDGKWIVYTLVGGANRLSIWKIPVDGGQSTQVSEKICLQPSISPDGKLVACGFRGQGVSTWKLAVFSFDGGPPLKMLDLPQGVTPPIVLRWSPDGRDIAFINTEEGRSNLWLQPVAGGTPRKLTNFTSDQIFSFDWTRDGRVLAYARGMTINDVVTISDSAK